MPNNPVSPGFGGTEVAKTQANLQADGGTYQQNGLAYEIDTLQRQGAYHSKIFMMSPIGQKAGKLYTHRPTNPIFGPELVLNGTFDSYDHWFPDSNNNWHINVADGFAFADGTAMGEMSQPLAAEVGKTYKVSYDLLECTQGNIRLYFGGVYTDTLTTSSSPGTYTYYIVATTTDTLTTDSPEPFAGSIDNVSIKEMADGVKGMAVDRNCYKTIVNPAGFLEQVKPNVPAITYIDGLPAVDVGGEDKTNLIEYPLSLDNAYWTKSGVSIEGDPSTAGSEEITGFSNNGYDTLTTSGRDITSAIVSNAAGVIAIYSNNIGAAVSNKIYLCTFNATINSGTAPYVRISKTSGTATNSQAVQVVEGINTVYFSINDDNSYMYLVFSNGTGQSSDFAISNISIKEVTGFAAPSVDYPNGAFKLVESSVMGYHQITSDAIPVTDGDTYSISILAKKGERDTLKISGGDITGNVEFNLTTGEVVNGVGTITPILDFYLLSVTGEVTNTTGATSITFYMGKDGNYLYTGDDESGLYLFGAQLVKGDSSSISILPAPGDPEGSPVTLLKDTITMALDPAVSKVEEVVDGVTQYPTDFRPIYTLPAGNVQKVLGYKGDQAEEILNAFALRALSAGASYDPDPLATAYPLFEDADLDSAVFALVPSYWDTGKLFAALPEDGAGDMTVSRASAANRINKEGKLQSEAINVPRIGYSDGDPVVLTEDAGENLIEYPLSLANIYWLKLGSSIEGDPSTAGSELVTDTSLEATYTNGLCDTLLVSGNVTTTEENTIIHSGSKAQRSSITDVNGFCYYYATNSSSNKYYKISVWVYVVGGTFRMVAAGSTFNFSTKYVSTIGEWVKVTVYATSYGTGGIIRFMGGSVGSEFIIDDISIKEVTGYPAPSVDYPNGAFKLVEDGSNGLHRLNPGSRAVLIGETYTYSIIAKAGETKYIKLADQNYNLLAARTVFDLENGSISSIEYGQATIEPLSNGFYRCSITGTAVADGIVVFNVYTLNDTKDKYYQGDGTSGVYLAFPQLEENDHASSWIFSGIEDGSTSLRSADDIKVDDYDNLPYNDFTMYWEGSFLNAKENSGASLFSGGSYENSFGLFVKGNGIVAEIRGTEYKHLDAAAEINTKYKVAFIYSKTGTSYLVINGQVVDSGILYGHGYTTSTHPLVLGQKTSMAGQLFYSDTQTKSAMIFREALTTEEAIELTTP